MKETTKENNELEIDFQELSAADVWERLYNKELTSKKTILEYVEILKVLKHSNATEEQIQENYNFVYTKINEMSSTVKPNTIMFLKNALKTQLGKYVKVKDPVEKNYFLEFFKKAYPEHNRRKDFTWVLMDINAITEEQIWNTLVYINREYLKSHNELTEEEKRDIINVIEKLVRKNNIKYINRLKSLDTLLSLLKIRILPLKQGFGVKSYR